MAWGTESNLLRQRKLNLYGNEIAFVLIDGVHGS